MSNLLSGSLIDKSPEARSFINQCVGNIDEFKLFPWESFTSIVEAIYSTTNVDLQGECFDLNGLQSLVDKVKSGPFYTGRNHDPLIHPIGRILTARVFQDRQTRCFFTAGITGFYDTQKIPTFESIGIEREDSAKSSGTVLLEFVTPSAEIEFNPHEFDQNFIDEILSDAPQL